MVDYLGEKDEGDSRTPGLANKAELLFEWGFSGVVSARFCEPCMQAHKLGDCMTQTLSGHIKQTISSKAKYYSDN